MTEVDLALAADGYLRSSDGHLRHIIGLERIARDAQVAGVCVVWHELPGHHAGFCDCHTRQIWLAPWLFWAPPWVLRLVLSHELGHAVVGPSQERARTWQQQNYAELIAPLA